ncbi:nucleolar protein 12-like isoform X2 [Oculina patagonica]
MAAKKKLKKEKKVLVFDENSRRDYLLGFRKRKNERRKKAKEDLTKKEKERRKEFKQEKKKSMAEQMEKHRKELEALESDDENDEQEVVPSVDATYDHPEHLVTVTTISDVNLDGEKFACIGPNRGLMETVKSQQDTSSTSVSGEQNNSLVKRTEK